MYDFHLTTAVTLMRKLRLIIINYRSVKHFPNKYFRESLIDSLSNKIYVSNDDGIKRFCKTDTDALNSFAPTKKKFFKANEMSFIREEFSREIMKKLRLMNNFYKRKQKNLASFR